MKTIRVRPTGGNQTAEIVRLLQDNRSDVTFRFERAEYHFYREGCHEGTFYPSNNKYGHKYVVFCLSGCKNVTIDGGGATFVFHDRVFPFIVEGCENVTLTGFTVDFAFPRYYSAVVKASTDDYLDLYIDKARYPYTVTDGHMICHTESEDIRSDKVKFFLSDFDKDVEEGTTIASIKVGDCPLPPDAFPADGLLTDAAETGGDVVRFTFRPESPRLTYIPGHNIVFHFDENREYDTFFVNACTGVRLHRVNILRGAGMGLIAQMTDDITLDGVRIRRQEGRGDLVSTTADALMFVDCGGQVVVKNSHIAHSLDDGLNLHGTYTHVESVSDNGMTVRLSHREQVGIVPFRVGRTLTVIDGKTLEERDTVTVLSAQLQPDNKHIIVRTDRRPDARPDDFALSGPLPAVTITDNTFDLCPSIIVGAAETVTFARNSIHNRCAGLRLVDSPKLWYEAGRARDVTVEDNEFISCGEGYEEYTLCVTVNAQFECPPDKYVHRNVRIAGNTFRARNAKLFTLAHADNVTIENNTFVRTGYFRRDEETAPVRVEHVRRLSMRNNDWEF